MIPSEILLYNQKLNKVEQLTKADMKKYRKLEVYTSEVEALNMAGAILTQGEFSISLDKSWYDAKKDEVLEPGEIPALEAGRKSFVQGAKALYTLASRLAARKTPEYKLILRVKKKTNEILQLSLEIVLEDYPAVVVGELSIVRDIALDENAALVRDIVPTMDGALVQGKGCQAVVVVAYYGSKRCANKLERNILELAKALALVLLVSKEELWTREEIAEAVNKISSDTKAVETTQKLEKAVDKNTVKPEDNSGLGAFAKGLRQRMGNSKVVLVGGNDNWRKKMATVFENPMIIEGKNFEPAKLQEAALVIINTNEVGHAVTKKASGLAANDRIRYIYTSKYNIEAIAQDILNMLEI